MNFRLIIILTLGILILISLILSGLIIYNMFDSNESGTTIYTTYKWTYFTNIAVLILAFIADGVLFLKG